MMTSRTVRARIEGLDKLPTIPTIVAKLLGMFESPRVSLAEMATFIAKDPVLAARVLRVVNSPIYGFPGRISSVTQALLLLGLNVARGVLLSVSVVEIMRVSIIGLWEHSVGCGIVAGIIAKKKGLKEWEQASVAGLLHDLGKVLLNLRFPQEYQQALANAASGGMFIADAERETFGVTHAEVGAWVGKKWNFPPVLTEQMAYHHKPHLSKQHGLYTAIVHFSDILIRGRGFGFGGDKLVPQVDPAAWRLLNLCDSDIREALIEMEDRLGEAEALLITDNDN
jgi:putative nucleotidyltransferase with HDIG domain